jgi:hypothetical protein
VSLGVEIFPLEKHEEKKNETLLTLHIYTYFCNKKKKKDTSYLGAFIMGGSSPNKWHKKNGFLHS